MKKTLTLRLNGSLCSAKKRMYEGLGLMWEERLEETILMRNQLLSVSTFGNLTFQETSNPKILAKK